MLCQARAHLRLTPKICRENHHGVLPALVSSVAKVASRSKSEGQSPGSQDAKSQHRYSGRIVRGQHEHQRIPLRCPARGCRGCSSQTQEIQRPKICARFGSATRLKAGSHAIGGRDSVVTTGDETVEVCLGPTGKRSPLWVRSTETVSA